MQFDALITNLLLDTLPDASWVRYPGLKFGVDVHEGIFKGFKGVTCRKLSVLHGIMNVRRSGYPQELVRCHTDTWTWW